MNAPDKPTILFSIIFKGETYPVRVHRDQYISLMSLIVDQVPISGFGLCCGMGSCGTCLVLIDGVPALACEVRVDFDLTNTLISIDESSY